MIDLNSYIVEKLKINPKTDFSDKYYILWFEELSELESIHDLEEIEPDYILKNGDYNEDDDEIKVKGKWEFYASENTNYDADESEGGDCPKPKDLVFEISGEYVLYRPGLNQCSGAVNADALIGTKLEILDMLKEYQKDYERDYDCKLSKLFK